MRCSAAPTARPSGAAYPTAEMGSRGGCAAETRDAPGSAADPAPDRVLVVNTTNAP